MDPDPSLRDRRARLVRRGLARRSREHLGWSRGPSLRPCSSCGGRGGSGEPRLRQAPRHRHRLRPAGAAVLRLAFRSRARGGFAIVAGLFPAIMDFLSSFAASNYVYPGQTRAWVFAYIFFGWIGVCGTCLLIAEGILAPPGADVLTAPRCAGRPPRGGGDRRVARPLHRSRGGRARLLGLAGPRRRLLRDPVAQLRWLVRADALGAARVDRGLPSSIARPARLLGAAALAVPVACIASVLLSLALNGLVGMTGLR